MGLMGEAVISEFVKTNEGRRIWISWLYAASISIKAMACLCLPSALWNSLNDWAMKCGCFPRIAAANQSTITSVFDINQGDRPKIQKNNAGIRAILLVSKHLCQKLSIMIQLFHIRYGYTHKKQAVFRPSPYSLFLQFPEDWSLFGSYTQGKKAPSQRQLSLFLWLTGIRLHAIASQFHMDVRQSCFASLGASDWDNIVESPIRPIGFLSRSAEVA